MRLSGARYGSAGREKTSPLLLLAGSIVLSILLGVLHNRWRSQERTDPLTGTVATAAFPFGSGAAKMQNGVVGAWNAFFTRKDLSMENQRLSREVARLRLENESLRPRAEEAQRLRRLLKFAEEQKQPPLPSTVIGWLPSPHYETITLGRGTRDGVKMQSIVRTPDGLVGVVDEASLLSSSVRLLSDAESQVHTVLYRGSKRLTIMGAVRGQGRGLPLLLRNLRREDQVKVGDVLMTTGYGGVYPPGIPVGKVAKVAEDKAHFLKSAEVESFAPMPGDLREVLVLP